MHPKKRVDFRDVKELTGLPCVFSGQRKNLICLTMISHQHRCIFVHIPKTAGNSVNRVFGIGWEDHKDLQRFAAELEPAVFGSYFKFAIIRNPWDRILSDYNYQLKKSRERDSKLGLFRPDGSPRDFAEWVEMVLATPHSFEPKRW